MTPLEFVSAALAALWSEYGVIATDADESAARNYWNAGLRDAHEVAKLLAKNHGVSTD